MPVRVKCRCGQELVLRYGEWVYFLLGLVLLCLVINSAALLLLYFRLDEAPGSRAALPAAGNAPATEPAPHPVEKPPGPEPAAVGAAKPSPVERVPAAVAPARPADAAPGGQEPGERRGETPAVKPTEERKAPASARAPDGLPDADVASILAVLPPWKEGERKEKARIEELPVVPWSKEAAVVRFLVLERAPEAGLLRHAFLLDPDRRLRRAAVDRLSSHPLPAGDDDSMLARRILAAAAPFLEEEPRRAAVFRAHGLEEGKMEGLAPGADLERILGSLEEGAASVLSDPALTSVRSFIGRVAERGMDVVLLIDVTRSMEGVLEPLQRDSLWLFPAIGWTFPGARIGIVLYRDDVEAAEGFAGTDSKDLVRVLRDARAEGGGDVPEGVHRAIEEALALGRFSWRPSAEKHIIVIGDAPPPYAALAPLTSLVGRAFREGGYRFHTVSIRPEDGRPAVPYFPEIARHGGGTSTTVNEPARLAEELFWRLFPPDVVDAIRSLGGPLKSLFAGTGA